MVLPPQLAPPSSPRQVQGAWLDQRSTVRLSNASGREGGATAQSSPAAMIAHDAGPLPDAEATGVVAASLAPVQAFLVPGMSRLPLVVRLEGPYPAPCQAVTSTRHAVLIAAGMGVTPAAAILASILARARAGAAAAAAIGESSSSVAAVLWPLARLDFVWLASEGAQFGWLLPLLQRFEAEAARDPRGLGALLHVHVYLTSLPATSDPATAMLHLALEALLEEEGVDVVVGLRGARLVPGRPAWPALLQRLSKEGWEALASDSQGRAESGCAGTFCPLVDSAPAEVFCCGPRALSRVVGDAASAAGLPFHPEPY